MIEELHTENLPITTMTNGELIDMLSAFPLDMEIVISKDDVGSELSPLTDLSEKNYIAESDFYGYLAADEEETDLYDDDDEFDQTYRSRSTGAVRVVVLFPVS